MQKVDLELEQGRISGFYDPRFKEVADQFVKNFTEREEVGASVALRVKGEVMVDLWGGWADKEAKKPWVDDTISIVYSCTKAAVAICAHILVDRGQLDLNAPVVRYWPEFGNKGKENITVAMLLNHSAGLPAFREKVKDGGYYDWDYMVQRLQDEEPFWEPGTRNGYHMVSFGWTVGEVVRRVSGMSLGEFFRREVAEPLGLDFWIGLPEELEPRVAPMIMRDLGGSSILPEFYDKVINDRQSISSLSLMNSGRFDANSRAAHAAQIGGAGGISNARALAKMYVPLACEGMVKGKKFLNKDTVARMGQVSMATQQDMTLRAPTRFALGFMKAMDNRHRPTGNLESVIISEKAFGHVGAGGSLGFADPENGMSFGYTMTKMGVNIMLNDRGQSLVDAAYRSLGYSSNAGGVWVK